MLGYVFTTLSFHFYSSVNPLIWKLHNDKIKYLKKLLHSSKKCDIIIEIFYGGIAQLGERLNGIQEVSGSIPLISTNKNRVV